MIRTLRRPMTMSVGQSTSMGLGNKTQSKGILIHSARGVHGLLLIPGGD